MRPGTSRLTCACRFCSPHTGTSERRIPGDVATGRGKAMLQAKSADSWEDPFAFRLSHGGAPLSQSGPDVPAEVRRAESDATTEPHPLSTRPGATLGHRRA